MVVKTLALISNTVKAIQYDGTNKDDILDFVNNLPCIQYWDDKSLCITDLSIYQSQTIVSVGDYIIKNQYGNYDCIPKEQIKSDYVVVSTDKV